MDSSANDIASPPFRGPAAAEGEGQPSLSSPRGDADPPERAKKCIHANEIAVLLSRASKAEYFATLLRFALFLWFEAEMELWYEVYE